MRIVGLDHVQLAMPAGREEDARAFYVGVLGLTEQPKPEPLAARGGCWFTGPANIHLGVETDFRPARKAHPAFEVEDLDAAAEALAAADVALRIDTAVPHLRRGYIEDPFGNRIELLEDTGSGSIDA